MRICFFYGGRGEKGTTASKDIILLSCCVVLYSKHLARLCKSRVSYPRPVRPATTQEFLETPWCFVRLWVSFPSRRLASRRRAERQWYVRVAQAAYPGATADRPRTGIFFVGVLVYERGGAWRKPRPSQRKVTIVPSGCGCRGGGGARGSSIKMANMDRTTLRRVGGDVRLYLHRQPARPERTMSAALACNR